MVTTNDLRNFVNTSDYNNLLEYVISALNITLNKKEASSQIYNIHAGQINDANIKLSELLPLCHEKEKLTKFYEICDSEIIETGVSKGGIALPPYRTFLIHFLINYYLLQNKPKELKNYFKKRRISNHEKHVSQLKSIYSRILNNSKNLS